jgi:hypothetical protein
MEKPTLLPFSLGGAGLLRGESTHRGSGKNRLTSGKLPDSGDGGTPLVLRLMRGPGAHVQHSRNRNCPQCQKMAQFRWVSARVKELLPVPYFHCVFTLPHQLNPLIEKNPRALIGALFKTASSTLLTLAQDPKWIGAKPGILMVLHTWGQKLNLHYHVHCIVTGGGLTSKKQWIPSQSEKYLFPVQIMSEVFRGKYWEQLAGLLKKEKLDIPSKYASYYGNLRKLEQDLYKKKWVVYAKEPFAGPVTVLKYLARYTHRTAIANSRILKYENGLVTFSYTDYRQQNEKRVLPLPLFEFLRRFITHVLPSGFMRIRGYGLWANPCKKKSLAWCRYLLGDPKIPETQVSSAMDPGDAAETLTTEENGLRCPHCKEGILQIVPQAMVVILSLPPILDSS